MEDDYGLPGRQPSRPSIRDPYEMSPEDEKMMEMEDEDFFPGMDRREQALRDQKEMKNRLNNRGEMLDPYMDDLEDVDPFDDFQLTAEEQAELDEEL